jgi:hypothetical protein
VYILLFYGHLTMHCNKGSISKPTRWAESKIIYKQTH